MKTAAGTASTMQLYGNAQSIAMGHVILDPLGSDLATSMANGAVEAADYFKSANPAVMALDFALGKDIYTGLPVNRSQVLTALALDVFGGEMFSVAGKGLAMLFTPGVDAGIAASTLMGAKLYLGSALESGLSGAIFGSLDSALVQPVKGVAAKFGLFGGVNKVITPEEQLNRALTDSRIYEQIESIHAESPNASSALRRKLSGLNNAQLSADRVDNQINGRIRYYEKFRSARTPGSSSGSRFVTEYNSETGDVTQWSETYDQLGNVNRIHLKNINEIHVNSPHFPPTMRELLESEYSEVIRPK